MEWEKCSLQIGAAALACAVLLRLCSGGPLTAAIDMLGGQNMASALLFLETGRIVRTAEPREPEPAAHAAEPTGTPEETQPVFAPEDAELVEVNSFCDYTLDVETMLQTPLQWDLHSEEPSVLILHTHTTESYTKTEDYRECAPYHTLDEGYNVVSVGEAVKERLEEQGITVLHDKTVHDEPSYDGAYECARKTIEDYMEQYPSIRLVLDIHRDAAEDSAGGQVAFRTQVAGQDCAKLMVVVGTDAGGLEHPDWQENMSLAVKLHAELETIAPGICRPINFRSQRFNQDLCPGALLIEIGSAGNTRQEALAAAEILARGILDLASGTA